MENKMSFRTINQKFVVLLLRALSHFPFWVLYLKSDFLSFLIEYVVRYRRTVIDENLRYAFPEKSKKELETIRKKYYRHLSDLAVETLKLHSIKGKKIEHRILFKNTDLLTKYITKEKGVIVLAMHQNNWEWGSYMQTKTDAKILEVYNKMRDNVPFDNFLLKARGKWGGEGVVMSSAARTAFNYSAMKKPVILWLAADQSAPQNSPFWTLFMNREAAFFSGPVKISQKLNQPLFFQRTRKVARGIYEIEFELLFEEPAKVSSEEILKAYVRKMEKVIREEPEYYLWSHRRWKHTRPEGTKLIS